LVCVKVDFSPENYIHSGKEVYHLLKQINFSKLIHIMNALILHIEKDIEFITIFGTS
jgi:hypothetical protein